MDDFKKVLIEFDYDDPHMMNGALAQQIVFLRAQLKTMTEERDRFRAMKGGNDV